jgi:hypothetical protein
MNSDDFLRLTPDEILEEARYGKSLVIVEGEYDFIYEYIADSVMENHYEIITIESFINKSGNRAVENLILEIEIFAKDEGLEYIPYLVGIVDRDYREYENRLTQSDMLYILDFYSIESYFANKEVLRNMLLFSIRSERLVTEELIDMLYIKITNELENELYKKSIEKIKKHINTRNFNIPQSFDVLLKITKGKELLNRFILKSNEYQRKLYSWCRDGEITPCKNKKNSEHEKFCLYIITRYDIHQLRNTIFKNVNLNSLIPIKERIRQLK